MQAIAEVVTMYSNQKLESLPKHEQSINAEFDQQFWIRRLSDNNITRDRTCFFAKPHLRSVELPSTARRNQPDRGSSEILYSSKPHGADTNYSPEPNLFGFSDTRSTNDLVYEQYR